MKPTPGPIDPEEVRRLRMEGLGVIAIARRLRRRNDLVVACLRNLGLSDRVTKEWMTEQYVTLGRSVDDIASERGVGESAIRRYLRRFSIPQRYRSRGRVRNVFLHDPGWLREMYWDRGLSMRQVAIQAGCTTTSLGRAMSVLGIPRRSQTEVPSIAGEERVFLYRLRQRVLDRDGRACRWPDCGSAERLEINHIIPTRLGGATAYENGITLCRAHHHQTFGREMDFAPLFQKLVSMGPLT